MTFSKHFEFAAFFSTEKEKVNKKDPLPLEKIELFMKFLV